jgi:NADH dehydrogenase (ubiquinone) Fe-S protein 3
MYLVFKNIIPYIVYQKYNNENSLVISVENLAFSLKCLKNHYNYKYTLLSCLSGVDLLGSTYRFSVVYDLLSLTFNSRLRIKIFINEATATLSIINVHINANWWEREIWDLYGIYFKKHNDMRRLLTDYGFDGYPMRKDFPLYGYLEVCYNEKKKRITYESIQLCQAFRNFSFEISV